MNMMNSSASQSQEDNPQQKQISVSEAIPPRFSVIIPTYQRRDVVVASVCALANQNFNGHFEVIVVVDGSTDGTVKALRELTPLFPLTVIEQANQGASVTRNNGAITARGELLLFLDDDMEAHPDLLTQHQHSHQEGADAVIGHIPLHPEAPANFISKGVGAWAERRVPELLAAGDRLPFQEFMTGQLSIARKMFFDLGGFDTNFTFGGSFGNEDLDFGLRLQKGGYRIVFNPNAVSWQRYVVTPHQYLRQWRQAGRADVVFVRKHPEQAPNIFIPRRAESWKDRFIYRWLRWLIRWFVLALIDRGVPDSIKTRLFLKLRNLEYWRGVGEAGGKPQPRSLRVLCYHSISDLAGDPIIKDYGIPPDQFRQQLDILKRAGFQFIDANEFLRFLQGKAGLPRRPVLLTFDDCYQDILDAALPILKERNIPAVAFAVSRRLGGTNDWDKKIGASQLQLLDADGLLKLAKGGVTIGSHSRTHRMLNRIPVEDLPEEIAGSVTDLEAIGLDRSFLLAYPHGEYDQKVQQETQASGLQAAFTVEPGFVQPGQEPFEIPRIEILREDKGWKFLWKVLDAGRSRLVLKNLRFWLKTN